MLTHPMESDAGNYTCCLTSNCTKKASAMLKVIGKLIHIICALHYVFHCLTVDPVFVYGSSPLYENKTALCYHNIFLNCSVNPTNRNTMWEFRPNHVPLYTRDTNKYAQNSSGLTIYNVTNDDQGLYVCVVSNANPLEAFISLNVTCHSCKSYLHYCISSGSYLSNECLLFLQGPLSCYHNRMRH